MMAQIGVEMACSKPAYTVEEAEAIAMELGFRLWCVGLRWAARERVGV